MTTQSRLQRSAQRGGGPGRVSSILALVASVFLPSSFVDSATAQARPASKDVDPGRPLATSPGFRMLPDGRSTVWLYLDRVVVASSRTEGNRFIIDMPEVQVGVRNNTNPLVTTHFPTPLSRTWLRAKGRGAELVLELKKPLELQHSLERGPRGVSIISVVLPALDEGAKR